MPWPQPSERRVAVRLTPEALRAVKRGHPWVFATGVAHASHEGAPGDLAVLFDDKRAFVGLGLWDPASPIRVRVLHRGRPTPVDEAFWAGVVDRALARRGPLLADRRTTGWRVLHGEADGVGGLVVDRYDATVVAKVYSEAWWPHLGAVLDAVAARLVPDAVVLRLARAVAPRPDDGLVDGAVLAGSTDGVVAYAEHGLVVQADVVHGQKTGAFLDQRDNRAKVGGLAEGARVLDVFACTGGFSLHAAAGGAVLVHSVDLSERALDLARAAFVANHDRPAVAACRHRTTAGDAFAVMGELAAAGDAYDVVVVDPPSFANRAAQVPGALAAYGRLTELALALVVPGGVLVQASCSSRVPADDFYAAVHQAAQRAGRRLHELGRTGHPLDHPTAPLRGEFPEGTYLKAIFARTG